MSFFRRKKQKGLIKRDVGKKVSRPKPYTYRAVRDGTDRTLNRGDSDSRNNNTVSIIKRAERLLTTVVIVVIVFSFLYLFWLDSTARVRFVENDAASSSTLLREIEVYESGVNDILHSEILFRTKLTINTKKFEYELLERFPELATATVTLPLTGHRPVVSLQAKKPALILISNGHSYVIDQAGFTVLKVSDVRNDAQSNLAGLPRVSDQSSLAISLGKQVITHKTVTFLRQLTYQYAQASISLENIVMPANKPNEVHVRTKGSHFYVKYIVDRPADVQFGAFQAVVNQIGEEGAKEYIDVRVEGKVFYK